jgi:hypothetical protein
MGCERKPPALPAPGNDGGEVTGKGVHPDILAVREHRLRLEAPPSFVFTTGFRNVP